MPQVWQLEVIPNLHRVQRRQILEYAGALWVNASVVVDEWRDWQEGPGRMTQGDLHIWHQWPLHLYVHRIRVIYSTLSLTLPPLNLGVLDTFSGDEVFAEQTENFVS